MEIRLLKANEIECRIGSFKDNGMSLLLYKDARADMKILDETFGYDGWERKHELIDGKLFCTVSVWSDKRSCWISKQDVGTESNAEKEKGQASDSFKRACFNLGIGRELYTAPFIWINASQGYKKYEKFEVKEIGYNESREINKLVIVDSNGNIAYQFGTNAKINTNNNINKSTNKTYIKNTKTITEAQLKRLYMLSSGIETSVIKDIISEYGFSSSKDITMNEYNNICNEIENLKARV